MTTMSWDELIKNSAGSFDPIPNGDYDVVCVEAQPAGSSTGKAMIKAKFRVQGGPHDGRSLWNQFTLSPENPNALSFWFQHMKVFGMDSGFFAALPPVNASLGADDPSLQYIAQTMLNRSARVTVTQRSWQGQQRNNITAIKPLLGPLGATSPQVTAPGVPSAVPTAIPQAGVPQPQAPAPAPQLPAPQPVAPPAMAPAPQPMAPAPLPVAPPVAPPPAAAPQPAMAPPPPVSAPPAPAPAPAMQPQVIGPPAQPPIAQPPAPAAQQPPTELAF